MRIFGRRRQIGTAEAEAPLPREGVAQAGGAFCSLAAIAGGADRIAVVDCETTGIYNADRVVEVAIVTVDLNGQIVDAWDTLVQPERDVGASHIHGLSAASLRDAPVFADIAGDIAVRLHGACLAAHNLPFDVRMLSNEFIRLGADLTVLTGIDTLAATRSRLGIACLEHGIRIVHAHSALGDALATAELLVRVSTSCASGGPAVAPTSLSRAVRTFPRSATAPVHVPDPPYLISLIASLDHAGAEAATLAYLELVGRALADLRLASDERKELTLLAASLGLDAAHVAQAHRRFVNDLIDAALEDHIVTDDELDVLVRVASALEIDQHRVEQRTRSVRITETTIELAAGMTVVFTGDDPSHSREEMTRHAESLGMTVGKGVTKTTDLLVAYESASASGKAKKAHAYGVPIVSTGQFSGVCLGDPLDASGTGGGRKVVTCPDCRTTWTLGARSSAQSQRRCEDCAPTRLSTPRTSDRTDRPTSEELVCADCGMSWARERTRGRKPHRCPDCVGASDAEEVRPAD